MTPWKKAEKNKNHVDTVLLTSWTNLSTSNSFPGQLFGSNSRWPEILLKGIEHNSHRLLTSCTPFPHCDFGTGISSKFPTKHIPRLSLLWARQWAPCSFIIRPTSTSYQSFTSSIPNKLLIPYISPSIYFNMIFTNSTPRDSLAILSERVMKDNKFGYHWHHLLYAILVLTSPDE